MLFAGTKKQSTCQRVCANLGNRPNSLIYEEFGFGNLSHLEWRLEKLHKTPAASDAERGELRLMPM